MASDAQREANIEANRLHKKRLLLDRKLQKKVHSYLEGSKRASLKAIAGEDQWSRVSTWQSSLDFWRGIFHALRGIHRWCNPIIDYRDRLQREVSSSRARQAAARTMHELDVNGLWYSPAPDEILIKDKRDDGTTISNRDRLYSRIGNLQAQIDQINAMVGKDADTAGSDYLKRLDEEETQNQPLYDRWHKHLQRPAYFEQISIEVRLEAEAAAIERRGDAPQTLGSKLEGAVSLFGRLAKRIRAAFDAIANNALNYAIPIEAYFTFPAFAVLTPQSPLVAVAGALMFTGSLAGLGVVAGTCYRRAYSHTLVPSGMDMDIVHTQLNRMWIGFSVVALTVAALLVVSGADLRSKLPVMRDWLEIEEQLKLKQRDINRDLGETIIKDTTAPASARLDQKQQEYELAKDEHTKKREETLSFGTPTLHTDWLVGLGIYMFLVVLGAIKMIISSDPYFEYQLLAQSLRGVRESRLRLAAAKDELSNWRRLHIERYTEQINSLRSLLWLAAPNDLLALKPKLPNGADAPTPTPSTNSPQTDDLELPGSYGKTWVATRVHNYTRAYAVFRGVTLRTLYPGSFREVMSCGD